MRETARCVSPVGRACPRAGRRGGDGGSRHRRYSGNRTRKMLDIYHSGWYTIEVTVRLRARETHASVVAMRGDVSPERAGIRLEWSQMND